MKRELIIIIYTFIWVVFISTLIYSIYFIFSNPKLSEIELHSKLWFTPMDFLISIITIKLLEKWREKN